ncbi:MAG: DUF2723 domain-containing protein [Ignavibacteria bacterium]|nr:DUF2723 domain-containing protein [Ignavibacteria bacterium]
MTLIKNKIKFFWALAAFVISFIVYILTLAPGVFFVDSGELAVACIKLGIAHPTGYPLFTLIGRIFSLIPSSEPIYILNFASALFSSVAVFIFFYLISYILYLTERLNKIGSDKKKKFPAVPENINYAISFSASLILAFSFTFWNTANSIEVYNLHKVFLVLLLLVFLKSLYSDLQKKNETADSGKYWILFAFLTGLSFTNHLSTLYLGFGIMVLYFVKYGFNKESFKRLLFLIIPFILGISAYIYLFLRSENAPISWGYPHNWENFVRHISGKQFMVWMNPFSIDDVKIKQFNHFIEIYPRELSIPVLLIIIIGLIELYRKSTKFFIFTLLIFFTTLWIACSYDIYDIDSYFLAAFIISVLWAGIGLQLVYKLISKSDIQENLKKYVSYFILFVAPLFLLVSNYKSNDESKNKYVSDYTFNVFNSARPNSIIMSTQWDFWVSASWYYQYVKGIRPDVLVVDKELFRRGWYLRHMKVHYPEFYLRIKNEFDTYETELMKFEKYTDRYLKPKNESDKKELEKIQIAFFYFLNAIVDKNQDKNFYTTFEIEDTKAALEKFGKEYNRIPEGLLIRYTKSNDFDSTYIEPEFKFDISNNTIYYYDFLMKNYYRSLMLRANYLMNFGKYEEAEKLISKVIELENKAPANIISREGYKILNQINQLKELQK